MFHKTVATAPAVLIRYNAFISVNMRYKAFNGGDMARRLQALTAFKPELVKQS